jgi:hypothetical protein
MAKRHFKAGFKLILVAWVVLGVLSAARAQAPVNAPEPSHALKPRALPDRLPEKPSQPPAFSIPLAPLGFSTPSSFYLGQQYSFVYLDFLDENRLLFTFRVPGLIRREAAERGGGDETEHQIRAVVLALPAGTVESEALWTLHDRARYLWMLKDGRFLLRDRENLEIGDASLELKPFLRFPGPLFWVEMDPLQQYLVTDSREPAAAATKPDDLPNPTARPAGKDPLVGTPAAAQATIKVDQQSTAGEPDLVVRILRRESGQVMLVSRVRSTVHLPINSDGYLESLRGRGAGWLLNLSYFSGGSAILGQVDSTCLPLFDFLSQRELLVTTCTATGAGKLVAMGTDGRHFWEALTSEATIWPILVRAADGSRLARESMVVGRAVDARAPLDSAEIKGQLVQVLDAADGKVELEASASPVLDAGGNVAISPSGRRVALLNGSAIQIFELPASPPLPEAATLPPSH